MILYTERLILRPWLQSDADDLYLYAKDKRVGPIAGWPPHNNVEHSQAIIETVLMEEHAFALALADQPEHVIGSIGIMLNRDELRQPFMASDSCEAGYWLGAPFWGQGLAAEAMKCVIQYAFQELNQSAVWCGYYEGNVQSKRVQEKSGLHYQCTVDCVPVPLLNDYRQEHFTQLTLADWEKRRKSE